MDCGFLLSKNYKKHRSWFKSIKAYKGWSELGERQARLVLADARK